MRKRVNARRIKLRARRWTAVLLTAVMLLSCAACSDEYDEENHRRVSNREVLCQFNH